MSEQCPIREFLRWMSRGNSKSHNNPWIGYCRLSRTMITGYKKKKLGHPSEKLSGDVPCAGWRAVLVSEVIFPIVMAVLFIVAYMFVKAFPVSNGKLPPTPSDLYRNHLPRSNCLECSSPFGPIHGIVVPRSHARPSVPLVRFHHGFHSTLPCGRQDGWFLRVPGT